MNGVLFCVVFFTSLITMSAHIQAIEAETGRGEIEESTGPENPREKNPSEFDPAHEGSQQSGNSVLSPEPVGPTNGSGNRGNQKPSQFTNTTSVTAVDIVNNITTMQESLPAASTMAQANPVVEANLAQFQTALTGTKSALENYNPNDPTTQQDVNRQVVLLRRSIKKLQALQDKGVATDETTTALQNATELLTQLQELSPKTGGVTINEGGNTTQVIEPREPVTSEPVAKEPIVQIGDQFSEQTPPLGVSGALAAGKSIISLSSDITNSTVLEIVAQIKPIVDSVTAAFGDGRNIENVKDLLTVLNEKFVDLQQFVMDKNNQGNSEMSNITDLLNKLSTFNTRLLSYSKAVDPVTISSQEAINNSLMKDPFKGSGVGTMVLIQKVQTGVSTAEDQLALLNNMNNVAQKIMARFPDSGADQHFSSEQELGKFFDMYGPRYVEYCKTQVDILQTYSPDEMSINSDAIAKLLTNMKTIFNRMDMFTDVQKENGQAINQTRVTIDMLDIRQKVLQAQDNIKNHTMSQQTGSKIMNFLNNMQAAFGRMFGTASTKASVQDVVASARTVTDMCTEQIQAASQAMSGQVPTVTAIKEIAFYADIIEKQKQLLVDLKQELATMPIGQFALRQNIETAIDQIEPSLKQSLTTIEDTVSSDQLVEWQGQLQKALQPVAPYSWLQDGTQFQDQPIMYTDPATLVTFAKAIGLVVPNASNTQALEAFRAADINTLLNKIKTVTGQSAPTTVAQQIVRDMNGMLNASPDIVNVLKQLASPNTQAQSMAKRQIADGYQQFKQLQIAQFELAGLSLPTN